MLGNQLAGGNFLASENAAQSPQPAALQVPHAAVLTAVKTCL